MKALNLALRLLFIAFITAFLISFFNKGRLVEISNLDDSVKVDPAQTSATRPHKIEFSVDGNDYVVTPLYDYKISGIVVSKHDYGADTGSLSKPIRYDLCMVWGRNVTDKTYLSPDISFSQGDRFCNYNYSKPVDFDVTQISNNHLVTTNDDILKVIETIENGDEVVIKGMLIDLFVSPKAADVSTRSWASSTNREDTGAGACEVIYIESIEILASVHAFDKNINQYSMWGLFAVLAIFAIEIIAVVVFIKPKTKDAGGFIQ
ncbi:MAG: hypothetical protein WA087_04125 [Candidatus Saccharimonadales bacterium]